MNRRRRRIESEIRAFPDKYEVTRIDEDSVIFHSVDLPRECDQGAVDVRVVYPDRYPFEPPLVDTVVR